jgi:RNA polymerase sigma factor for flagellar operon FliA
MSALYGKKGLIELSKTELIVQYLPLVKKIAYSLHKKINYLIDVEDLIQCGTIGLLDALEKFKNDRSAQFETYASTRIYGSMVDELRKLDPLSQEDRAKLKKIDKVTQTLELENGHHLTDNDIAKKCDMSLSTYHNLIQLRMSSTLLHQDESQEMEMFVSGIASLEDTPDTILEKNQFKVRLAGAIDSLPEREKILMGLYYQEELTFKEIAVVLDLTEARISQLHNQAINRLRLKINN